MEQQLFIKLPIVRSDASLEKLHSKYKEYDPYYITSGCVSDRKKRFEKLWRNYSIYADSHFLTEVKKKFHQKTWEMYMGNVILNKGFKIESHDYGPDLIVQSAGYIECVAPTKGDPGRPNSVPEMFVAKTSQEVRVQSIPSDKIIFRITNSIQKKAIEQYGKWKNKKWFNPKEPFIIAINIGDLGYPDDKDMSYVIKALFGFHHMQIGRYNGEVSFSWRNTVEKFNLEPVPVTYFLSSELSFVSGVLFSDHTVLNHPDELGADCIFVNNPFAENIVQDSFSGLFRSWKADKSHGKVTLTRLYK